MHIFSFYMKIEVEIFWSITLNNEFNYNLPGGHLTQLPLWQHLPSGQCSLMVQDGVVVVVTVVVVVVVGSVVVVASVVVVGSGSVVVVVIGSGVVVVVVVVKFPLV